MPLTANHPPTHAYTWCRTIVIFQNQGRSSFGCSNDLACQYGKQICADICVSTVLVVNWVWVGYREKLLSRSDRSITVAPVKTNSQSADLAAVDLTDFIHHSLVNWSFIKTQPQASNFEVMLDPHEHQWGQLSKYSIGNYFWNKSIYSHWFTGVRY